MEDFYIQVDNEQTPSISLSTVNPTHAHIMIHNAELNDIFEVNQEMIESLTFNEFIRIATTPQGENVKSLNALTDGTSYVANFSLERLTTGTFIDGYNSGSGPSKIDLTGNAIVDGFGNRYIYPNPDFPQSVNSNPPIMVIWEDCFMSCTPGRVVLIRDIPSVFTGQQNPRTINVNPEFVHEQQS